MSDITVFIIDKLTKYGVPFISALGIGIAFVFVVLGFKKYKCDYINLLLHKRNFCWLITWGMFFAVILILWGYKVFESIPIILTLTVAVLFILFSYAVFASVKGLVFLPKWYIKKYDDKRSNGFTVENRKAIEKKPWYFIDKNEQIHFQLLKIKYLKDLNEISKAYEELCNFEKFPLYKSEIALCRMQQVFLLIILGNVKKAEHTVEFIKDKDIVAYCFLKSYISEQSGKFDEAFELAKQSENSIDSNYNNTSVKQGIYNHLGRLYTIKKNHTEAYRYYILAAKEAEKLDEKSSISIVYQNLIYSGMNSNQPKKEIEQLIKQYEKFIENSSLDSVCQLINIRFSVAYYFKESENAERILLEGYEELKRKSNLPQLAGHRLSILNMLQRGRFDTSRVVTDIESDLKEYDKLPLHYRIAYYSELLRIMYIPEITTVLSDFIINKVNDYIKNNALDDLDEYYSQLSGSSIGERCDVLLKKIDIYYYLNINEKEQLQLLKDIRQICSDNSMLLLQANTDTNIAKYYARLCEKGYNITDKELSYISELLNEAEKISEDLPWVYLNELLVNLASAYNYFKAPQKVISTLIRFDNLGLSIENCDESLKITYSLLKAQYFS